MAAYVILIEDPDCWQTIREFLTECRQGAFVLGPEAVRTLREEYGSEAVERLSGALMDYDFGGEADIMLDWADEGVLDHYAMEAVREHLGLPPEEEEIDLEKLLDQSNDSARNVSLRGEDEP